MSPPSRELEKSSSPLEQIEEEERFFLLADG